MVILDLSKKNNKMKFIEDVNQISKKIFMAITLGGSINSMNDVHFYLKNGADKILLNNMFLKI